MGTCEVCGDGRNSEWHHIRPKGMGGSKEPSTEASENLVTLCRRCHRNVHEGGWQLQRSDHELRVVDG